MTAQVEVLPVSALKAEGWVIEHYSTSIGDSAMLEHCFVMAREGATKIVKVRKKMMGGGVVAEEIEV